jgi:flagellar hook assembly protein FlgD
VTYTVAEPGHVALKVYDSRGRVVKVLKEGTAEYAGEFEVEWDGRDSHGRALPSGIYYAVLEVDGRRFTRKMVILK